MQVLLVSVGPFRYHTSADTTTAAVQLQSCGNNKTSSTTIIHRCVRYQHIRNRHRNTNIHRYKYIYNPSGTMPIQFDPNQTNPILLYSGGGGGDDREEGNDDKKEDGTK